MCNFWPKSWVVAFKKTHHDHYVKPILLLSRKACSLTRRSSSINSRPLVPKKKQTNRKFPIFWPKLWVVLVLDNHLTLFSGLVCHKLTDWLLAGWLTDLLTDWLTDRLTDHWMTNWATDWLTDWLTDLLADDRLFGWLTNWLTDWLTDQLADWLTDLLTGWLIDWPTGWLADWLTNWLTYWVTDLLYWLTD